VDHTDRGSWICATPQQLATGIWQELPGCLAYDIVAALKAGIEAVVTALAAMIKCGRDYNGDLGHRVLTLPEDKDELRRGAGLSKIEQPAAPAVISSFSSHATLP
jgi:hypothetical protein